ncbi:hypothetical protein BV22DRAFT_933230 [Leucogyrophana mollusca]|uniref:Uncharacterized protein n=1 Tax=Leucogyrophana mollusca TaxID=85980 RepID=A0ACB8AXB6_9AGAM|nr:hypothetical protein BV22DRAFT_933230 [Leucogyrophana mollusca]
MAAVPAISVTASQVRSVPSLRPLPDLGPRKPPSLLNMFTTHYLPALSLTIDVMKYDAIIAVVEEDGNGSIASR